MRKAVKIVSEGEYNAWAESQNSYYLSQVRNKEYDPNIGKLVPAEIKMQKRDFFKEFEALAADDTETDFSMRLKNINFDTGSDHLTGDSKYELDNLVTGLTKYSDMNIEIEGHTDNTGNAANNVDLSQRRANTVKEYLMERGVSATRLVAKGYGSANELESNDTAEGRMMNRRIEFKVLRNKSI